MNNIGKYEFNDQAQAIEKINGLGIDEDGNATHPHTIVKLGYIVTTPATYDEDGEELTAPVLSDKYSVDVLWVGLEDHPYGWKTYAIDITDEGVHGFLGLNYQSMKFPE